MGTAFKGNWQYTLNANFSPEIPLISAKSTHHISLKCHNLKHVWMNFNLKQPKNIYKSHP